MMDGFRLQMAHELSSGVLYALQSDRSSCVSITIDDSHSGIQDDTAKHGQSDCDDIEIDQTDQLGDEDPNDIFALKWGKDHYFKYLLRLKRMPYTEEQCPFERDFIRKVVKEMESTLNPLKVLEIFHYLMETESDVKLTASVCTTRINKIIVWPETYTLPAKVASAGKYPLFKKVLLVVLSVVFAIEIVYKVCSRLQLYLLNPYVSCVHSTRAQKNSLCRIEVLVHYIYGAAIALLFPETDSRLLTHVNLNYLLCPAIVDPFRGPYYRIIGLFHQTLCLLFVDKLVRLAGGPTPAEGRMELYYNGSYGTICQIGWDLVDATVVCKSLGYAAALVAMGGAAMVLVQGRHNHSSDQCAEDAQVICRQLGFSGTSVAFSNAYFGAGSSNQPIWLDDVNCIGTETNVGQCLSGGWGIPQLCALGRCWSPQLIRLAGGPTPAEGRVELYYNGSPCDQKG
eukprot:Em0197g2a